ncbi:MAG: hypothetical protein ACM3SS_15885 [Rhodospirillaceae bacterium]
MVRDASTDIVSQDAGGHYTNEASLKTAPGARTGLFAPEQRTIYVAAPRAARNSARILVYKARR